MQPSGVRLGLALFTVLGILACGGGGGGVSAPEGIGGTINTADFVLPAGETRVLTSDLTVRATKSIKIDGTLQVPPGMSFALLSDGPCTVAGQITAVPGAPSGRGDGDGNGDVDGTNVTISGTITLPGATGFNASTSGPNGKLTISGQIIAGAGTAGTASQSGGNGGSIQIGTAAAIGHAHDIGRTNDVAFQQIEITNTAVVTAGNGGPGWADDVGSDQGTTLFGNGNAGGDGGSVGVACTGPLKNDGILEAGDGGPGGGTALNFPAGKDGAVHGEKGESIVLTTGVGGGGGSCTVTGNPVSGGGKKYRGLGAYTGIVGPRSGSGGDAAPGGDITITLGYKGPDGIGDPVTRTMAKPVVVLFGGLGGDGLFPGELGGDGGKAVIRQLGGGVPVVGEVLASNFGSGGTGASGCIVAPFSEGAKGGKATAIDTGGATVVPELNNSLKGGRGGSGTPPGVGGAGPGGAGSDGIPCVNTELVVSLDKPMGPYDKGEVLRVDWFENAHVALPELPVTEDHGCTRFHLHANQGQQVYFNDKSQNPVKRYGPFPDPNGSHCGFGRVFVRAKVPSFGGQEMALDKSSCCGG